MKNIELGDVLIFHRKLIKQTGGSDGIRDLGLIESALIHKLKKTPLIFRFPHGLKME